jgi:hypothetical protein
MSRFQEILGRLAPVQGISRLELLDDAGIVRAVIENKPGQAGSLAVYCHLLRSHGRIDRVAAIEGLSLYAEHTDDARRTPGKHPNIDRLIAVAEGTGSFDGRIVPHSWAAQHPPVPAGHGAGCGPTERPQGPARGAVTRS